MAVKAQAQVTLSKTVDVSGVVRYYKLQSSTLAKPAKPTTRPPSGWSATEPGYAEGSTNSLYTCEVASYSDGTWSCSEVSLSSSYEAAKQAYNEAKASAEAAKDALNKTLYAACNTAAATAAKAPASTVAGFSLVSGASLRVKFTYANTASAPTLDVNGTGARQIRLNGANSAFWAAGATVDFVYDGTYWQVCSTPLYGSTATIGNPAGGHVCVDGDGIVVRKGSEVVASFGDEAVIGKTSGAAVYAVVRNDGIHLASQGAEQAALKIIEAGWNVNALDVTVPMQVEGNLNVVGDIYSGSVKMGDFVTSRRSVGGWRCTDYASGARELEYRGSVATGQINETSKMYVSNALEVSVPESIRPLAVANSIVCADNDSFGIIGKTMYADKVKFRVMSWYNTGSVSATVDVRVTGTWK